MMLGRVDEVDGHYVATRFLALVIPTGSMYVTSESSARRGNVTTMSWQGVPIRIHLRSVALAYPRVWLPFLALAWPFILHWGENVSSTPPSTWLTSLAFIAVSALSHVPGRLSEEEKARLRVLGSVTGMRLDPARLHVMTREAKRDALADLMTKGGLPTGAEDIVAVLEDIPTPALPLVYGYCRYAGDDATWRECAERVYEHIVRTEV